MTSNVQVFVIESPGTRVLVAGSNTAPAVASPPSRIQAALAQSPAVVSSSEMCPDEMVLPPMVMESLQNASEPAPPRSRTPAVVAARAPFVDLFIYVFHSVNGRPELPPGELADRATLAAPLDTCRPFCHDTTPGSHEDCPIGQPW